MALIFVFLWVLVISALVIHQRAHHFARRDREHLVDSIHQFRGFEFLHHLISQKKNRHAFWQKLDSVAMIVLALCLVSLWTIASYNFLQEHAPQAALVVQQETVAFWGLFGIR